MAGQFAGRAGAGAGVRGTDRKRRTDPRRARHSRAALIPGSGQGSAWGEIDIPGLLNPEVISALQMQGVASQVRTFSLRRLNQPVSRLIDLLQRELD